MTTPKPDTARKATRQPAAGSAPKPAVKAEPPERMHRPEPQRTAPIRNAGRYFRAAHSWETDADLGPGSTSGAQARTGADAGAGAPAAAAETEPSAADDPVAHGVALGYEVIEEYIRMGRDAARDRGNGAHAHAEQADLADFLRRALHLYQDAGGLVHDVIEQLAEGSAFDKLLSRVREAGPPGPAPGSAGASGTTPLAPLIGVALATTQPAQAWTELHAGTGPFTPTLDALHRAGGEAPPITALRFGTHPSGAGLMLHIGIDAAQPPGVYSGVILDAASGLPRGTACVRIGG